MEENNNNLNNAVEEVPEPPNATAGFMHVHLNLYVPARLAVKLSPVSTQLDVSVTFAEVVKPAIG